MREKEQEKAEEKARLRERERGREIEWGGERGVNNIFISPRIYSRQSVRHH